MRAVHYFGFSHPTGFWDSASLADTPRHLARMREDGFDTIILVVPWRGFQKRLSPSTFDERNLQRLRSVMSMIEAAGLDTILRVSYPWEHSPDNEGTADERILGLFTGGLAREAWCSYLKQVREVAEASGNFRFSFFSWEDMPSIRELMPYRPLEERRALAHALGFAQYLAQRFEPSQLAELYGTPIASLDGVHVPLADCDAYAIYSDFVNEKLRQVLELGRGVWPALCMQVRVDFDGKIVNGVSSWVENDVLAKDPSLRVTYWSPCMYAPSPGQEITVGQALDSLARMLRRVTDDGANTNHFLDQFLFHDESPHFSFPHVAPERMEDFLRQAALLLKKYSRGYGLWNYFDYRVNHFYNAMFLRGLEGWDVEGGVKVEGAGESCMAHLPPGGSIAQVIDPHARGYGSPHYDDVRFSAKVGTDGAGSCLAIVNDGEVEGEVSVQGGKPREVLLALPSERHRHAATHVGIRNIGSSTIQLTDVCLWGAVYRSRIYDEHGKPERFLMAVRAMNRAA